MGLPLPAGHGPPSALTVSMTVLPASKNRLSPLLLRPLPKLAITSPGMSLTVLSSVRSMSRYSLGPMTAPASDRRSPLALVTCQPSSEMVSAVAFKSSNHSSAALAEVPPQATSLMTTAPGGRAVGVAVRVGVKVAVAVAVGVNSGVAVRVGLNVAVAVVVGVNSGVAVAVAVAVAMGVSVGVTLGRGGVSVCAPRPSNVSGG